MKSIKTLLTTALLAGALTGAIATQAADGDKPVKAYPLKTCVVSGEKLGGMGEPYVFKHEGREVKLCCKGCLKQFNKDSAKFIKKLEVAEKQAK